MRYFDLFESFNLSRVHVQFRKNTPPDHCAFRAVYDGNVICSGEARKDREGDGGSVIEIVVVERYRRMGVATKVYNMIEQQLGWKLHPSDEVKPDGQEFWKNRLTEDQLSEAYDDYAPMEADFKKVLAGLKRKYGAAIGEGRNREVFKGKNVVIKFPKNDDGVLDNYSEFQTFKKEKFEQHAKCRIVHIRDVPLLVMELIDTTMSIKDLPSWATSYDCFQVGKNHKGDFKAYDYAR